MANSLHADILYDYLVQGYSQQNIADQYGLDQTDVSEIIREIYGLNQGNVKWGNGEANQRGKYPNLSYEDICAFIDSGSDDLDAWLGGDDGYYQDNVDYTDDYQQDYSQDYSQTYDDGYANDYDTNDNTYEDNSYNQPQYNNGRRVRYVNPDDYDDNGNYIPTRSAIDGRIVLLILGVVILALGWLVSKLGNNSGIFGEAFKTLWHSNYLWWGVVTGGIFGFIKYQLCKNLGEVFTTCGTWSWTGVGYIIGAVLFVIDYGKIFPAIMLAALGALIFAIGYKLFYKG